MSFIVVGRCIIVSYVEKLCKIHQKWQRAGYLKYLFKFVCPLIKACQAPTHPTLLF